MTRNFFTLLVSLFVCLHAFADDTFTSPQVIVNARIDTSPGSGAEVFTGAYLYYDTLKSAYHVESQRDAIHLANREQVVTLLQSRLVRFSVRQLRFSSVSGDKLETKEVIERLKTNALALMLPDGAKIHPQLAMAFKPDTVIVSRTGPRPTPLRLVPRPDGG